MGFLKKCKDGIYFDTFDFLGDEMSEEELEDLLIQYEKNKDILEW